MMYMDEEIRIDFGNGEIVLLQDEAIWHEIKEYIDNKFDWLAKKPVRRSFNQSQLTIEQESPEADLSDDEYNLLEARKINYLLWVLGSTAGRLHKTEAYRMMLIAGYEDFSSEPVLNLVSKARKYPYLITLENGYFNLTSEGWKAFEQLKQKEIEAKQATGEVVPSETVRNTEEEISAEVKQDKGQSIDYLLRALVKLGGSAKHEDLVQPMLDEGWKTASDTESKRRRTISAIASNHKEYFDTERGLITINMRGFERLMTLSENQDSSAPSLYNSGTELPLEI